MVSPRRSTDVENLRAFGHLSSNIHGIKSQNLQKPASLPLGDVSNILKASQKLQQKLAEASKSNKEEECTKCEPKSACAPVADQVEEVPDPIWDAPLAFGGEVEDTYWDIIPLSLQLTSEDISRLVFNGPRSCPNKQSEETYEFDLTLPEMSESDDEQLRSWEDSEDELPPVDSVSMTECDSSFWRDDDYGYEMVPSGLTQSQACSFM